MGRITYTQSLGQRPPELGQIVFFHPKRVNEDTPTSLPAIIHHISDRDRVIVDLTIFAGKGPLVRHDVEQALVAVEGRWSHQQS